MNAKNWMIGLLSVFFLVSGFSLFAQTGNSGSGEVQSITQEEFKKLVFDYDKPASARVYQGKTPVIVDFYADWCMPCHKLAPILKEIAATYKGKVIVYKVDVDQNKELAKALEIQSIPYLLFVPVQGKTTVVKGVRPKAELDKMVNTILLKK